MSMPTPAPQAKYLFRADFLDGFSYQQTESDCSETTPGRNAFYDVLQRIHEVVRFTLLNQDFETNYEVASVDLITGLFTVNGIEFAAGDPRVRLENPVYRLVYIKRHTHRFGDDSSPGLQAEQHQVQYHIGWQTNKPDGSNYQITIGID